MSQAVSPVQADQSPASPASPQVPSPQESASPVNDVVAQLIAEDAAANGLDPSVYPDYVAPQDNKTEPDVSVGANGEPKPTEPEADPEIILDPKFAKLREKEMDWVTRDRDLKAREARLAELEAKHAPPKSLNDKLKALGYSKVEDFIEDYAKTNGEAPSIDPETAEIRSAVKEILRRDRDREQAAAQQAQLAAVNRLKGDISTLIEKSPELELLKEEGGADAVYQIMNTHFNNTIDPQTGQGQVLPIAVAAKFVNKQRLDYAQKLLKYATVQQLVSKSPSTPSPTSKQPGKITTISGDVRSGATPDRPMNDDELFADVTARLNKAMQQDRQQRR